MRNGEVRDRLAALERYVLEDAERWRRVHERIDALRGVLLGVVVGLQKAHPEVGTTLVEALRRFEQEAGKLQALDAAVGDTREFLEMIEAHRR